MSAGATTPILRQIHRIVEDERTRQRPDRDLLAEFVARRDEPAYQALVRRHGPMVLEVCRCLLANEADAEDAFQATFLILARKARSVRKAASLGSWLHGVAYRTALKVRAAYAKRRKHETQASAREPVGGADPSWRELQRVLHEELNAIGERQRAPLVLCYLQGKTQDDAAALLGIAKSTLKLRLEQGRGALRARLVRRGLGPAAVLLASAWPGAAAELPAHLASAAVRAAALCTAGQPLTAIVPAQVAALAEAGWTVTVGKAKATALALILATALGVGVRGWGVPTSKGEPLTAAAEAAVRKALEYLAAKQNPDGSFGAESWQHSVGLTATCGLALVGGEAAGLRVGGDAVARALLYVTRHQQPSGLLSHRQSKQAGVMYDHALGTWFLASLKMSHKRDDLLPQLDKAVRLIESAQNAAGGWRYRPVAEDADVTLTAIQVGALVAARDAGVKLGDDTLPRAAKYLKSCQTADGGFAYQPGLKRSRFFYTAVALAALEQAGMADEAVRRPGLDYCLPRLPERSDHHDELVLGDGRLFVVPLCAGLPDDQRDAWRSNIRASVLEEQQADGSWPTSRKGDALERTTALAAMTIMEASQRSWSAPKSKEAPARGIAPVPPTPQMKVSKQHPPRLAVEAPDGASWAQAAFLDNDRILVSGSASHLYEIRSARTGALLKAFPEGEHTVRLGRFRLSANRRWLAAATATVVEPGILLLPHQYVSIWDVTTGKQHGTSGALHSNELLDVASDGRTVALLHEGRVEIWELVTSEMITNKRLKTAPIPVKSNRVDAAAFSPDGSLLVVSVQNENYYWKWRENDEPIHISVGRRIESLLFSPDGRLLVEGPGPRSDMDIRDLPTMRVIQSLHDEVKLSLTVPGMAFTDQGRTLIAGNTTTFIPSVNVPHRIHFWDVATGKLQRQIALEQGLPRSLDVSPDGKTLAVVIEPYRPQPARHEHEPGEGPAGPRTHAHDDVESSDKTVLGFWNLAPAPVDAKEPKNGKVSTEARDRAALQGQWQLESINGERVKDGRTIRFDNDTVTGLFLDEQKTPRVTKFKLLADRAVKGIDVGPQTGPVADAGFKMRGIYNIKGDTLTFGFLPKLDARQQPPGLDREGRLRSFDPNLVQAIWLYRRVQADKQ